jgi:hypothetical protein
MKHIYILLILLFVGCGHSDGRIMITGKVTVDGASLDKGAVTFYPMGSGVSAGASIAGGAYSARIIPGRYVVQITADKETGQMVSLFPDKPAEKEYVQYIPTKYNTESTLTIEVEAKGKQDFSFDLELK